MTTTSDEIRSHVNSIEPALTHIRYFLDAIALITEAMEEPHAGAVNVIVHAAGSCPGGRGRASDPIPIDASGSRAL